MNAAAEFIVLSLASARVASCITKDEIFRPVRERVYRRYAPHGDTHRLRNDQGELTEVPARMVHWSRDSSGAWTHEVDPVAPLRDPQFLGELVECPYCLSFWVACVATLAWWLLGDTAAQLALPFALWCAANIIAVKGL